MTTDTTTDRAARFQIARTAYALERIAATLEALSLHLNRTPSTAAHTVAVQGLIDEAAGELAHHADAIREASGLNADAEANLHRLLSNPSTR